MLHRLNKGVLCTTHQELGYPYGSTINLACDDEGQPFTFVSTMAEHTANLLTCSKCSIVVAETQGTGDSLAQARMTLVGDMTPTDKTDTLRSLFLRQHPSAFYVDFEDFMCMRCVRAACAWFGDLVARYGRAVCPSPRMAVSAVRYIGGFGEMSWVAPRDYLAAPVDPVGEDGCLRSEN